MTYKISPSLLEQYRKVSLGINNKTGKDLVDYMLGECVTSPSMSRGTAYHKILEFGGVPYIGLDGWYRVFEEDLNKTWVFSSSCVAPALEIFNFNPHLLHELWTDYDTVIDGQSVKMRMRLDGLNGLIINEFKTTSGYTKLTDYSKSLQWRAALLAMPQATEVKYTIFKIGWGRDTTETTEFTFIRDPSIEGEVHKYLRGFISWVKLQDDERLFKRLEMTKDRNPFANI